ncbi:MAG: PAS domain-containing sensor histidine kinase [Rhodovibrio sp.]|nr:PAS domain-containing sensor histidine kinase [Rhodovibrio sp.]
MSTSPSKHPTRTRALHAPDGLQADAGSGADASSGGDRAVLDAAWPLLLEMAAPLYIAAADGRVIFSNAAFDTELGPALLGTGGKLPRALVRRIVRAGDVVRQTERLAGATPEQIRTFEGLHRPVPAPDGGPPRALIGTFTEVTRAREAIANVRALRGRFEEILSTVSDWVWEVDAAWTFTNASTRDDRVLGFDPVSVIGRNFFALGDVSLNPKVPKQRLLKPSRRAPFEDVLYVIAGGTPEERIFEVSGLPKFDEESGAFVGFQGSARDVTQEVAADRRARNYRRELEEALAQLRAKNGELNEALVRAQAADQAKNQFLAMVGHELRTPLNAVIGFSEMMDQEIFGPLGDPRYDAYIDDVLASSRHLLGVINDIIDVVKLELDELRLHPDGIAVARLLETCAAFVREKASREGIDLAVKAPADLPELVADPQKVRQMLVNLLTNAVKFTDAGGRITLAAERQGEEIAIWVADTGIGIPYDLQQEVLQPFKQVDGSLARNAEGLGIGLPLTAQLAHAHGGRLTLESVPDEGTTVTLHLPLEPAADAPVDGSDAA